MTSHRKENDELLAKVLGNHDPTMQELNFINTVFGFLNRKTKFLSKPNTFSEIQKIVHKHIDKAKEKEIAAKERRAKKKKAKKKSSKQSTKTTAAKTTNDDQKDSTTSTNNPISELPTNLNSNTNTIAIQTDPISSNESDNTNDSNTSSTINVGTDTLIPDQTERVVDVSSKINGTSNEAKDSSDNDNNNNNNSDDEGIGQIPVNNGGKTDKYIWSQTLDEIEMKLDIPKNKTGKDILVEFNESHLLVKLKSDTSHIINGAFHEPINEEDCTWTLDEEYGKDTKTLTLFITKKRGMNWWNRVIIGDPEINTRKIEPANSKLDDLEPDVRQTVEKMMFDQRAKAMGKPTSKEREQQQILEKFKLQHPEMDFSNVKFG